MTSILGQLLFEEKEKPQPYNPPTFAESQAASVAGNRAVLPEAEALASDVNRYNQAELMKALRGSIPNFDEIVGGVTKNITSGLKGEIPKDVQDQLQNFAAARGLGSTGVDLFGSGFGRNLVARDIAKTSYEISQQAIKSSESWLATASQYLTAPRMDVSRAFVTPVQQFQADTEREANMFNYRRYLEKLRVQPEPWEKAVEGLLDWIATTGTSIAGAYAGNIGGMAGGGGQQPGGGGGGGAGPSGFAGGPYSTDRMAGGFYADGAVEGSNPYWLDQFR